VLKLIISKLLQGIVVLLIVSALTFALLAAAGGDALTALGSDPLVSEATVQSLRRVYGLDQPLAVRYARWLGDIARGRMGQSIFFHAPVWTIIRPRLAATLALGLTALLIAWTTAIILGGWAARRAGGWADRLCEVVILVASSTPRIVLALVALAVTARTSLLAAGTDASGSWSLVRILFPALVLAVPLVAIFLAQTRDNLRATLGEDFVQVARAKGLSERAVILRHALRPSLNPLITIFGYSLGGLVSGSVIVETVLDWPGLGQLSVIAVRSRDVPLLMGVVLMTATAVLIGNAVADILLRLNDPRLRRDESRSPASTSTAAPTA
jgi:peptide/nickel transport system permease protein